MLLYFYDSQGRYLRSSSHIVGSPLPNSATTISPPISQDERVPVWLGTRWELRVNPQPIVVIPEQVPDVFTTSNLVVSALASGNPLPGLGNTYYADTSNFIVVETDIVNEAGEIQTQLDAVALGYPPVLQVPIVKIAKGDPAISLDEIYFVTTLVAGHLRSEGKLPSSGNWKIMSTRVNESIAAITKAWQVTIPTITFYANELSS